MAQQFDNALHVMEVQGGSFVKSLAACYYAADATNRPKLRTAFASYFDQYEARFRSISGLPPVAPEPTVGAAQVPTYPHIKLLAHEIQSGHDRVRWAEGLIRQLPETHDGRNSWLLNYAAGSQPSQQGTKDAS